ncbi:hypothetical protein ABMA27_003204 [Loxostege sticticalis]|uniref:Uncharacterized protein n=1 Tax=Loxostege sticticalis TaxID=481309 RepID=A0ABR3HSH7_LOXSC
MPFCSVCNTSIGSNFWIGHLRSRSHKQNNSSQPHSDGVEIVASAFRFRIISYRIVPSESDQSLKHEALKKHTSLKVNFELFSIFMLFKNTMQKMKSFLTKKFVIYQNYDFDNVFFKLQSTLKKKIDEFQESYTGGAFLSNSHIEINVNKYQLLGGCSYVKLPKCIQNKKACLNIHNKDQFCFLWSGTAALYSRSHPERVSSFYKELGELPGDIKVIPKTKENYVSFTKFIPVSVIKFIQVRFVDSFKFLGTSLDRLAKTIKKEEYDHLHRHFPIQTQFNLLNECMK